MKKERERGYLLVFQDLLRDEKLAILFCFFKQRQEKKEILLNRCEICEI